FVAAIVAAISKKDAPDFVFAIDDLELAKSIYTAPRDCARPGCRACLTCAYPPSGSTALPGQVLGPLLVPHGGGLLLRRACRAQPRRSRATRQARSGMPPRGIHGD